MDRLWGRLMNSDRGSRHARPARAVLVDERGAVFAEYVTILALVSIGCVIATVALGVPFTNLFIFQRAMLLLPFP